MHMYRKKFVPSAADLGVGGGPCRFQTAAGLWALKVEEVLGCEGVYGAWVQGVVLGRQLRVMAGCKGQSTLGGSAWGLL